VFDNYKYLSGKILFNVLNCVFILFIFNLYCLVNILATILAIVTNGTMYSKAVVKLYSNVTLR